MEGERVKIIQGMKRKWICQVIILIPSDAFDEPTWVDVSVSGKFMISYPNAKITEKPLFFQAIP
jgi:hypothetical protein